MKLPDNLMRELKQLKSSRVIPDFPDNYNKLQIEMCLDVFGTGLYLKLIREQEEKGLL